MAAQSAEVVQLLYWVPGPTGGTQRGTPLVWGTQFAPPPHTGTGLRGLQVPLELEAVVLELVVLVEVVLVEVELVELELEVDEALDDELLLPVQAPLTHSSPPMHITSQPPQWALLNMMSTQIPPQSISLGPQLVPPPVPELVELAPPVPLDVEVPELPVEVVEVLLAPPTPSSSSSSPPMSEAPLAQATAATHRASRRYRIRLA